MTTPTEGERKEELRIAIVHLTAYVTGKDGLPLPDTYLTFLVEDIENPMVPGYPARSLKGFPSFKESRSWAEKFYAENGQPKYDDPKEVFCNKRSCSHK